RGPVARATTRCASDSTVAANPSPSGTSVTSSVRAPRRSRVCTSAPEPPGAERVPRARRGGPFRRGGGPAGSRGGERGRNRGRGQRAVVGSPGGEMRCEEAGVRVATDECRVVEDVLEEGEVRRR